LLLLEIGHLFLEPVETAEKVAARIAVTRLSVLLAMSACLRSSSAFRKRGRASEVPFLFAHRGSNRILVT
jgi:hypothetical protein